MIKMYFFKSDELIHTINPLKIGSNTDYPICFDYYVYHNETSKNYSWFNGKSQLIKESDVPEQTLKRMYLELLLEENINDS